MSWLKVIFGIQCLDWPKSGQNQTEIRPRIKPKSVWPTWSVILCGSKNGLETVLLAMTERSQGCLTKRDNKGHKSINISINISGRDKSRQVIVCDSPERSESAL